MSERESRIRPILITFFPMFIATLSLVTSIYNGYLNSRFLDFIEHNTARVEYMRTCKDIIGAYFQIKFRAGLLRASAARGAAPAAEENEARDAVNKFAALGTYLANLRDNEAVRARYTDLSDLLSRAVREAAHAPDLDKLFEPADAIFSEMNDDCVKSAKAAL
jgi:hypothetical protein